MRHILVTLHCRFAKDIEFVNTQRSKGRHVDATVDCQDMLLNIVNDTGLDPTILVNEFFKMYPGRLSLGHIQS